MSGSTIPSCAILIARYHCPSVHFGKTTSWEVRSGRDFMIPVEVFGHVPEYLGDGSDARDAGCECALGPHRCTVRPDEFLGDLVSRKLPGLSARGHAFADVGRDAQNSYRDNETERPVLC